MQKDILYISLIYEVKTMIDEIEYPLAKFNVKKSNALAMSSIFDYSSVEMDMANYITTLIMPIIEQTEEDDFNYSLNNEVIVDFNELCHMTGTMRNGKTYKDYLKALDSLRHKEIIIRINGLITSLHWISEWWYDDKKGRAIVHISENMIPLLFNLKANYLSYKPEYTMLMGSKYSKRIYEELKAYYNLCRSRNIEGEIEYKVEVKKLKKNLSIDGLSSYNNFNNFETKILIKAIAEINERTDIEVKYTYEKTGRSVSMIIFTIKLKDTNKIKKVEEENRTIVERTKIEY